VAGGVDVLERSIVALVEPDKVFASGRPVVDAGKIHAEDYGEYGQHQQDGEIIARRQKHQQPLHMLGVYPLSCITGSVEPWKGHLTTR